MLDMFIVFLLIYELIALGFFAYSLGQDADGKNWSFSNLRRGIAYDRREAWFWFRTSQLSPPLLLALSVACFLAWVVGDKSWSTPE